MIEGFASPWGSRVEIFTRLSSTSRYLFAEAVKGAPAGLVAVAEEQTAGYGRRGRQWHSPAGLNLYFSVLLRPELDYAQVPQLSLVAVAALWRALDAEGVAGLTVKWPNDLYLGGCKLAGIIAEMQPGGRGPEFVVLGIGLNVNTGIDDFPPELRGTATSLFHSCGRRFDRARLLAALLEQLAACEKIFYRQGLGGELAGLINANFYLGGREVVLVSGDRRQRGRARGIDDRGRLLLDYGDGRQEAFAAGEAWLEKQSLPLIGDNIFQGSLTSWRGGKISACSRRRETDNG